MPSRLNIASSPGSAYRTEVRAGGQHGGPVCSWAMARTETCASAKWGLGSHHGCSQPGASPPGLGTGSFPPDSAREAGKDNHRFFFPQSCDAQRPLACRGKPSGSACIPHSLVLDPRD